MITTAEAPPSAATMVEFDNFGRHYDRRGPWAVRGVTTTLPAGSITALVGPNGAGKSTLIRACIGFEPVDEGAIRVAGADTRRHRREVVENTGYVPQTNALYRDLTIGDHLLLASGGRHGFDRHFVIRHLDELRLPLSSKVGSLSGGQQAHVALALALGTRARVLLLDEPLASLDPLARRDFLSVLLRDARERSATVLLSSHIVTDVQQTCDRLVVLAQGRLLLHDSVERARTMHCTRPVQELAAEDEPIGVFAGPDGQRLALVDRTAELPPASLEEVVLGYLASRRP